MKRRVFGILVLGLSAGFAPVAAALSFEALLVPEAGDSDERTARESEMYDRGTRALDDGEWEEAARSFRKAAEMGGARADGATYWVAYALNKQGRPDAALEILRGFAAQYPKSSWRKEARALELEIQPASGRTVLREDGNDEDLKLMAINSLMNTEPERAIPLLEKVLNGSASPKLKERALFVLAQSASPRGREILASAARGKSGPDLQEKAIHYLGVFGGKGNAQLLSEIYDSTASNEVKERVLHAFMVSGNRDRVLAAARTEKSPALRSAAVHQLGVMGARAELWQMYRAESTESVKDSILQAMFIAGDVDHVLESRADGAVAHAPPRCDSPARPDGPRPRRPRSPLDLPGRKRRRGAQGRPPGALPPEQRQGARRDRAHREGPAAEDGGRLEALDHAQQGSDGLHAGDPEPLKANSRSRTLTLTLDQS